MAVVQSEGALVAAHRPFNRIIRGMETYDGDFSDYATLFRTQPNIRLCNGFLARNIAQLGLHAFAVISDDERSRLDRHHGLSQFIRRPNPYITRYAWVNALVHDLGIYDTFCALKVRNQVTGQLRAFRIPPYMFEPIGDSWIAPDGIKILGNRERPEFGRDQIIYIHGYNPQDPRTGVPPLESLRRLLNEEASAGRWREQYWKNAARMGGIIERPAEAPKWTDPALKRFKSEFQSMYAGDGALAGATPVLEEGMTWKPASFSAKDSEYLDARRLSREETAAAYFISPLFVGILDHANFSNVAEQHKHLYQDTLGPRLVELEEEHELQVFPEFPDLDPDVTYLEFNLAEKLKGTFEEQATVLQTLVGAPVMVRDEGRARLNLPPLPNGEGQRIVTPLNVLVGGQASPRDTAPTGTGAASRRKRKVSAPSGRKAVDDLPAEVQGWHAKHVEVLSGFFDRQKASVLSRIGAGQHPDEAWDTNRWNDELEADLLALSTEMSTDLAGQVADRFGGTYDAALAHAYLAESSRIAAENINTSTSTSITAAWTSAATGGLASRRSSTKDVLADENDDEEPLTPLDAVAGVFAVAAIDELATSRVTSIGNFARHEGAQQSGVLSKVWVVNSARSRHPEMAGETVGLDDLFSNGGRWPGDPGAGADESAGCTCSLDFSLEAP